MHWLDSVINPYFNINSNRRENFKTNRHHSAWILLIPLMCRASVCIKCAKCFREHPAHPHFFNMKQITQSEDSSAE